MKYILSFLLIFASVSAYAQKKVTCGTRDIIITGDLIGRFESVQGKESFGFFDYYLLKDASGIKMWSVFTNAKAEVEGVDYFDIGYESIDKGSGMEGTTTVALDKGDNEYYKPREYYYITLLAPDNLPFKWTSYSQWEEAPTEKTNTYCIFNFNDRKLAEAAQLHIKTKVGIK